MRMSEAFTEICSGLGKNRPPLPVAAYRDGIFVCNKAKVKLASGTVLSPVVLASLLTELDCSSTTKLGQIIKLGMFSSTLEALRRISATKLTVRSELSDEENKFGRRLFRALGSMLWEDAGGALAGEDCEESSD